MIKSLEIRNFKSVKRLELDCGRINIFIGEPNTGKSNILETLGLLSFGAYGIYASHGIRNFVRMEFMGNLFYDENLDEKIEIRADDKLLDIEFGNGGFEGEFSVNGEEGIRFHCDYSGVCTIPTAGYLSSFKFYRFAVQEKFEKKEPEFLLPPSGENLLSVLMAHKDLKSLASQIFEPYGLKVIFKPHENRIEVLKQQDEDVFISFPYSLASETLQRIVFFTVAVNSNRDSVLVFEEPEAHAFPYYTKFLAEKIALDTSNQYFISTHNPYFLLSILEKAPKDDVKVYITYLKNYQTKTKLLHEEEIEEIMDREIDVFLNIERFLEG